MTVIYRYELEATDNVQVIELPKGAKIIHVHENRGKVCFWAEHEIDEELQDRHFYVVGTGRDLPSTGFGRTIYLGTAHVDFIGLGMLVWHVYEVEKRIK